MTNATLVNHHAIVRGNPPDIGDGAGNLVQGEVFDQAVAAGEERFKATEDERQVKLTCTGDFLIDVQDETIGEFEIFQMGQRRQRPHDIKDMVDPVATVVDLLQTLKMVNGIHDQP